MARSESLESAASVDQRLRAAARVMAGAVLRELGLERTGLGDGSLGQAPTKDDEPCSADRPLEGPRTPYSRGVSRPLGAREARKGHEGL